jgi:hypothetical protein
MVLATHPETSNYTLKLPAGSKMFPTFHASELKRFKANDAALFLHRKLMRPGPVMTENGLEEYLMESILDVCRRRKGAQFLVRWSSYGPEHTEWLLAREVEDCEALDVWYAGGGDGPANW